MILYLDVDGTLITTNERAKQQSNYTVGLGCLELLQYVTSQFECRWLTFHARAGYLNGISRVFREALKVHSLHDEWKRVMDLITPASWCSKKTDGINFDEDFLWIDDDVSSIDLEVISNRGATGRLVKAHLNHFPSELFRLREILEDHQANRRSLFARQS